MPKLHTHLHLAIRLMRKAHISDPTTLLLGSAYPDRFDFSVEEGLRLHYKRDAHAPCDLSAFLRHEEKNAFGLGYFFHLWADNHIAQVDAEDITPSDRLICDMEAFLPFYEVLRGQAFVEKERMAMQNILSLEGVPMPLYLVPREKKMRYEALLDALVDTFLEAYPLNGSI